MRVFLVVLFVFFSTYLSAQQIPANRVVEVNELGNFLKEDVANQILQNGGLDESKLASYFREKFSERFFYDYRTFEDRLLQYNQVYRNGEAHQKRALDHMGKYSDSTQWVLPFNYLTGEEVNAYAIRHLARQHKMADIIFLYFQEGRDAKYIQYFENQMRSLNAALEAGEYEKIADGNGVYEVFRSGYRILNWSLALAAIHRFCCRREKEVST